MSSIPDASDLDGYDELSSEDQAKIQKAYEEVGLS
jgi:hypothetical protein